MDEQYLAYEDLEPGRRFPEAPYRYAVTAEAVAQYRAVFEQARVDAPPAEPHPDTVPPTFAAVYFRGAKDAVCGPPGGVHARQSFVFHRPVAIGDVIHTALTVKERYERNGAPFVAFDIDCRNQDGVPVTSGTMVQIWGRG